MIELLLAHAARKADIFKQFRVFGSVRPNQRGELCRRAADRFRALCRHAIGHLGTAQHLVQLAVQELHDVAANQFLTVVECQSYVGTRPAFTKATKDATGLQLSITEPAAAKCYIFEASTDLVTWTKLLAKTSAGGTHQFNDTRATFRMRGNSFEVPVVGKYYIRSSKVVTPYLGLGVAMRRAWQTTDTSVSGLPNILDPSAISNSRIYRRSARVLLARRDYSSVMAVGRSRRSSATRVGARRRNGSRAIPIKWNSS